MNSQERKDYIDYITKILAGYFPQLSWKTEAEAEVGYFYNRKGKSAISLRVQADGLRINLGPRLLTYYPFPYLMRLVDPHKLAKAVRVELIRHAIDLLKLSEAYKRQELYTGRSWKLVLSNACNPYWQIQSAALIRLNRVGGFDLANYKYIRRTAFSLIKVGFIRTYNNNND